VPFSMGVVRDATAINLESQAVHLMKSIDNNICPLCLSTDVEITLLPYPLFRHMDFSPFHPGPNKIGRCRVCQLVYRIVGGEEQREIDAIYCSETYLRHEEPHTLLIDGHDVPVPMPYVQARILAPFLRAADLSVLDIGCFDGRLLSEIEKVCHASDLCGFDVGERPQFPCGEKFRFASGGMETIHGRFDLIIMSHSIQYIRDIPLLFERIRGLLKPGGQLFIQVPDFSTKPTSLLLGDLYYHYDRTIVENLFGHMGFTTLFLDNPYFPRDILVAASPGTKKTAAAFSEDFHLNTCLSRLAEMTERLDQFAASGVMGVLGTTIDAAFADHCLGAQALFFVDENPKKVGTSFHGKPVLHPQSIKEKDVVVIPMGATGEAIRERFSTQYKGVYVCA
jgi:SAM-dependent methyltransferase